MLIYSEVFSEGGCNTEWRSGCQSLRIFRHCFLCHMPVCFLRSCWHTGEMQTGDRRAWRWGLPNCGIQGATDSIQASLQPQLLPSEVLLGKENKEKKTWELRPADTVVLSVQELFCKGTWTVNAELLFKLQARTAA